MRWGKATAFPLKAIPRAGRITVIILLLSPCMPRACIKPKKRPILQNGLSPGRDRASGVPAATSSPSGQRFAGSMHVVEVRQAPSSPSCFPLPLLPKPSKLVSRQEEGRQAGGKEAAARQGGRQGWGWCAARPRLQSSRSLIGLNYVALLHTAAQPSPQKVKLIAQGQARPARSCRCPHFLSSHPTAAGEAQPCC